MTQELHSLERIIRIEFSLVLTIRGDRNRFVHTELVKIGFRGSLLPTDIWYHLRGR